MAFYESIECSVALPLWSLNYEHSYDLYNYYGYRSNEEQKVIGNETIKRKVPAKGIVLSVNYSWILANMSPKCNLSFMTSVTMGHIKYDIGVLDIPYNTYNRDVDGILLGIPLTLDLKVGGEATFDKSDALSFSAGAGLAPMAYINGYMNVGSAHGTLSPCAHVGFGFFLGAEWKIQASVIGSNMTVLKLTDKDIYGRVENNSVISAKTTAPLMSVGIICFPFSYGWDKGGW